MSDLYQDITITLNLSEITKEKYHKIIKKLKELSEGEPSTHTYSGSISSPLSEEHKKLLESLQ